MAADVTATRSDRGITLHFTGAFAEHANAELLAGCARELLQCAEQHACLQDGVRLTDACFETISRHHQATQCLTKGLGFAERSR
jgi:hypothetical protein